MCALFFKYVHMKLKPENFLILLSAKEAKFEQQFPSN